jgi:glycosyltransferase involved in cell wall biosynthesis
VLDLFRAFPPQRAFLRLLYEAERRSGFFKTRCPASGLERWLPSSPDALFSSVRESQRFFVAAVSEEWLSAYRDFLRRWQGDFEADAGRIMAGEQLYFFRKWAEFQGAGRWSRNPFSGQEVSHARHWSELGFYSPVYGDLKIILEPSRFASAFALVRAYRYTGDEEYAECFWQLFEDWSRDNPPQAGPLWVCGQECSIRVFAWCFALYGLLSSPHTTPARVQELAAQIHAHADRTAAGIIYASSQRNNHTLSEAAGLWTVGLTFPEFRHAKRWREEGKKALEAEAPRQIGEDGSFIQHSFNYHRLMLHDYIWALRLGEINQQRLSSEVYERVDRAVGFLYQYTDSTTGQVPNYGSNDGALVLPLNGCDYTDFRPVLQAGYFLLHQDYLYPPGPWDEDLGWLFGVDAMRRSRGAGRLEEKSPEVRASAADEKASATESGILQASRSAQDTGYYVLRGKASQAMIRCARYKDRPGHADQLHLDLFWRGINVACDAGSYLYNGEPPWGNGLAGTAVHNTVAVDGRDQMTRAGRFLWLDWAQGSSRAQMRSDHGLLESWEGEHDGYRKLGVTHRRSVLRAEDDLWVIVDDLVGSGEHKARLHWLFADFPYEFDEGAGRLLLKTPAGTFCVHVWCGQLASVSLAKAGKVLRQSGNADEPADEVRGWRSRYYAEKEPALSLALHAQSALPLRFVTVLAAAPASVKHGEVAQLNVQTDKLKLGVELSLPGQSPIVRQAAMSDGGHADHLATDLLAEDSHHRQPIHLLLIHQSFTPPSQAGGTRHFELTSRLVKQGHRATIIASDVDYLTGTRKTARRRLVTEQDLDGVRILNAYTYSSIHRSFLQRVISFLSFACTSLFAATKAGKADVVMGTTPPIFQAVSAWLAAAMRRRPFLLEIRDLWPEFAIDIGVLKNPFLIWASRKLERFLYRRADHLVVNSPAYRDYLMGKGVPAGKITLIPNGVDPEMFRQAADGQSVRDQFGLGERFVVIYAGALGMANDLETVLRAADRLRDDRAIHFLLVGDGKERAKLEAQARELNLSNVTFAGPQSKSRMHHFLAASDACVATLKDIKMFRTTYPNKVFDYMAAGRPTILAIDGVIREVVEKSEGGIFVPPGNDQAMAEAVRSLSRDRARAQRMGESAREYVHRHFHRQSQAEQLALLLGKLTPAT